MFNRLDLWLLDRVFNPLSIQLFKRYGINNFSIAKILMMFGTAVLVFLAYKLLAGTFKDISPIFLTILCMMEFYWATIGMKSAINQELKWKNPKPGALPENLRDAFREEVYLRRFFLTLTIVFGSLYTGEALTIPGHQAYLWRTGAWILILTGFYFLGCTPPGPRERRERETRGKLAHATSRD